MNDTLVKEQGSEWTVTYDTGYDFHHRPVVPVQMETEVNGLRISANIAMASGDMQERGLGSWFAVQANDDEMCKVDGKHNFRPSEAHKYRADYLAAVNRKLEEAYGDELHKEGWSGYCIDEKSLVNRLGLQIGEDELALDAPQRIHEDFFEKFKVAHAAALAEIGEPEIHGPDGKKLGGHAAKVLSTGAARTANLP